MDAVTVVFLSTVINRITETGKRAFLSKLPLDDDQQGALVLFVSLLLGVLAVVLLFPSTNLFVGLGSSVGAEQVATGIVIGGLANGIDFLATRIARPESTSKATLSIVQTEEKTTLPPAA